MNVETKRKWKVPSQKHDSRFIPRNLSRVCAARLSRRGSNVVAMKAHCNVFVIKMSFAFCTYYWWKNRKIKSLSCNHAQRMQWKRVIYIRVWHESEYFKSVVNKPRQFASEEDTRGEKSSAIYTFNICAVLDKREKWAKILQQVVAGPMPW